MSKDLVLEVRSVLIDNGGNPRIYMEPQPSHRDINLELDVDEHNIAAAISASPLRRQIFDRLEDEILDWIDENPKVLQQVLERQE
jgi:hypothetical protein